MDTEDLNIELIFPISIGVQHNIFSKKENDFIVNKCYDINKNISNSDQSTNNNIWFSGEKSPKNSFFSSYNMRKDEELLFFFNKIDKAVEQFALFNNDQNRYRCVDAWYNIYESENYQEPHSHPMMTYSVVYFAQAPEGSGSIVFMNPVINELGGQQNIFPTASECFYKPQENMLLIFRSNLKHYVLHGSNKVDRISIACNYALSIEDYAKNIFKEN